MRENAIQFLNNEDTATVTFSQGRYISKILDYAEKYPEECQITHKNKDGSIVAHIPVKWLHITRINREISEEQREQLRERLKKAREQKD